MPQNPTIEAFVGMTSARSAYPLARSLSELDGWWSWLRLLLCIAKLISERKGVEVDAGILLGCVEAYAVGREFTWLTFAVGLVG